MVVQFARYDNVSGQCIPVGYVDDYTYFRFGRSYAGVGTWDLQLPISSGNEARIRGANVIKVGSRRAGLITQRQFADTSDYYGITFSGVELKGITTKRIVMPPAGSSHQSYTNQSVEYVIDQLIRLQIINPADATRRVVGTVGTYVAGADLISYAGRYSALAEDISAIAEAYGVGWYAEIIGRTIVWHIYRGVDRRVSTAVNSTLLLSGARDNIAERTLDELFGVPNAAIVAGQGEGVDRDICVVHGDLDGLSRNELFVDARDIESAAELPARGEEALGQQNDMAVYAFALQASSINDYFGGVFELGDQCTIRDVEFMPGVDLEGRFTEVEEIYAEGARRVTATIGYDKRRLAAVLASIRKSTSTLLTR